MAKHHDDFTKHVIGFDVHAVKEIADWIPDRADAFLQMWLDAGTSALLERPQTKDETASRNFAVALVGNLAWAATCVAPEAKLVQVLLSFGGAAVGSGMLASSDAWPVKEINTQLAQARDAMSKAMHAGAKTLASAFVGSGYDTHERRDQALWHAMFTTPYNNATGLLGLMRATIGRAFKQYDAEYETWSKYTEAEAMRIAIENSALTGDRMPGGVVRGVEPGALRKALDEVRSKRPFRPKFAF
jgi:hypothetical protein